MLDITHRGVVRYCARQKVFLTRVNSETRSHSPKSSSSPAVLTTVCIYVYKPHTHIRRRKKVSGPIYLSPVLSGRRFKAHCCVPTRYSYPALFTLGGNINSARGSRREEMEDRELQQQQRRERLPLPSLSVFLFLSRGREDPEGKEESCIHLCNKVFNV